MTTAEHESKEPSLFKPGRNCWQVERASHATMLVDCANYYRALHQAVSVATHSVFVLGWDIDSRIELLRDDTFRDQGLPCTFFDLVQQKARENPNLMFYLNRWDYSWFMAAQREGLSKVRWYSQSPPNVKYCLDGIIPLGACHHQKIVVVDDEIAFCGGMDIALNRWDHRHHYPKNPKRVDPGGVYAPGTCNHYGPYHDIQMIVAGPVVQALSKLARERWRLATGVEAIGMNPNRAVGGTIPPAWPEGLRPQLTDIKTAISLTVPQMYDVEPHYEIEALYLDLIARAERFIYMENQFFSRRCIAEALNRRLREKPELRALLVSCYDPEGIMERKAMWHGRVLFRDALEAGGMAGRVVMAYPTSGLNGDEKPVRIHSKIMMVDDRYLRVGSSNINNRSMMLDTECDLVIEADDVQARQAIAHLRNDLIREHTGMEVRQIEQLIQGDAKAEAFLKPVPHSRQHLRRINDEAYRNEMFAGLATRLADPEKPFLPAEMTMAPRCSGKKRNVALRLMAVILAIIAIALIWKVTPLAEYATPDRVVPLLEQTRNTPWAIPAALVFYILGCLVFFPHMVLTAVIVIVFAPLEAFMIAMGGSLVGGAIGFMAGRVLGMKSLRALVGLAAEKISYYVKKGGILGVTLLRMVPVAPYTVVNLGLGMTEVSFGTFMAATFLGMLPGTIVAAFLGYSMLELWQNPNPKNLLHVASGVAAWLVIIIVSHILARQWKARKESMA